MFKRRNRIDYGVLTGRPAFGIAVENIIMHQIIGNIPKECKVKEVNLMSKNIFKDGSLVLIQTTVSEN